MYSCSKFFVSKQKKSCWCLVEIAQALPFKKVRSRVCISIKNQTLLLNWKYIFGWLMTNAVTYDVQWHERYSISVALSATHNSVLLTCKKKKKKGRERRANCESCTDWNKKLTWHFISARLYYSSPSASLHRKNKTGLWSI